MIVISMKKKKQNKHTKALQTLIFLVGLGSQFLVICQLCHLLWGIKTILFFLYLMICFKYKNNLVETWVNISSAALNHSLKSINTEYLFCNDWDLKPSSLGQHAKGEC